MRTLLENITLVKGVEYMIVIAFCFGFIALWMLVRSNKATKKNVIITVVVLGLVFAGAGVVLNKYFFGGDVDANVPTQTNLKTTPEYFNITYGSATEFHEIMDDKIACTTCHHNSVEIQACKDCHNEPYNVSNMNKPGLKAAYHERCIGCHADKFDGADSCVHCHTGETTQIISPKIHSLTWENCNTCHSDKDTTIKIVYHDNCLTCHSNIKRTGAAELPTNHIGRDTKSCQGCHISGVN